MWECECSAETMGPRAAVWALSSDPTRWSEFDPGIAWARLDGPFVAGARGELKPKGGPRSAFEIAGADPERSFVGTGKLPLARLRLEHELSDAGDGRTRITHRIRLTGPLSGVIPSAPAPTA